MVERLFILPRSHDANMALEHRNDNTYWREIAKPQMRLAGRIRSMTNQPTQQQFTKQKQLV